MSPRTPIDRPTFPFYSERWLQSGHVRAMSLAVRGAYIELLCWQHIHGALPDDEAVLAGYLNLRGKAFRDVWTVLAARFPVGDDGLRRNPSLARKLAEQAAWRHAKSEDARRKGRASAARRNSLKINEGRGTAVEPVLNRRGTGGQPKGNVPTTHVMGSSVVDPARATPPAPPTRANPPAWPKGMRPVGAIVGEIAARVLAHHPPPPDAPDTTGEAGPGLEREGAA